MPRCYVVRQTVTLVHYVDADSPEAARTIVERNGPLSPRAEWDTDCDSNDVVSVETLEE